MSEECKPSYYDYLVANDIGDWLRGLLETGHWYWREADGKLAPQLKPGISETPWHHVRSHPHLKCGLWHQIMFSIVGGKLPGRKFVPSPCQSCFKVVVRPKTLRQLFELLKLQKQMDVPSKCGIEKRPSVHGLYGGYFYTVGMEEGLERYKQVRQKVDEWPGLGPDIEVFLKRACTEYEHACGDSDTWEITKDQVEIEGLINRWVVSDDIEHKQPEKLIEHTHRQWIEWAYANGDPTYADFTGGKPLYRP